MYEPVTSPAIVSKTRITSVGKAIMTLSSYLMPSVSIPIDNRIYAVGDVHGHKVHLEGLLQLVKQDICEHKLREGQNYTYVFLGDYVDRGPNSKGVLDILVNLQKENSGHIFLKGNHDKDFYDVIRFLAGDNGVTEHHATQIALSGFKTYRSYGIEINFRTEWQISEMKDLVITMPSEHKYFLASLLQSAQSGPNLFVHDPWHVFGQPNQLVGNYGNEVGNYLFPRQSEDGELSTIASDQPMRKMVIVHGHMKESGAASPEDHKHRIGLDYYSDSNMGRINCVVLEKDKKRRFLSFCDKLEP